MSSVRFSRRRDFLHIAGLGWCGLSLSSAFSADSGSAPAETMEPLNRFPHMMQEWLIDRVREAEKRGNASRAALQTKADALAYVASCRERIRRSFGPEPEKAPLNAKITGVVERDALSHRKGHLREPSRLSYNWELYSIPTGRTFPLPAVVGVCGTLAQWQVGGSLSKLRPGARAHGLCGTDL